MPLHRCITCGTIYDCRLGDDCEEPDEVWGGNCSERCRKMWQARERMRKPVSLWVSAYDIGAWDAYLSARSVPTPCFGVRQHYQMVRDRDGYKIPAWIVYLIVKQQHERRCQAFVKADKRGRK